MRGLIVVMGVCAVVSGALMGSVVYVILSSEPLRYGYV